MKNTCMSDHAKKRTTSTRVITDKDSLIKSLKAANAEQLELMDGWRVKEKGHIDIAVQMISKHTSSAFTLILCCICGTPHSINSKDKTGISYSGYCDSCLDKLVTMEGK